MKCLVFSAASLSLLCVAPNGRAAELPKSARGFIGSHRHYDDALRDSSKREPLEFCNEVLRKNLPVTAFLDSDFLVINERMAKHYDSSLRRIGLCGCIPQHNHSAFRRIS